MQYICDRRLAFAFAAGLGAAVMTPDAQAVPIDPALSIIGEVFYDAAFAADPLDNFGPVTQTGDISKVEGGVAVGTPFSGALVGPGPNPLPGTLTDIGDGFGMHADIDAIETSEFQLAIDLTLDLENTSPTDTFKVTVKVMFSNSAASSGADAFSDSEFTLDDSGGEFFFTDVVSDTLFGNEIGGVPTGEFGGLVSDAGMASFDFILLPLAMETILGELVIDGGVFAPGAATADFEAFVGIEAIMNLTRPVQVPEPGSLVLLGSGLLGLGLVRRRRMPQQQV